MKIKLCIATMMMSLSMGVTAQDNSVDRIKDLVSLGNYEQVLVELDKTHAAEDQMELKKLRALANLEFGQYAIAEILYLSINIQDSGVDVSNNLGLAYLRQLKFVEAIQVFQNTIRRFPDDAAAYKNLGDAYLFLAQSTYKKGADTIGNAHELQAKHDAVANSFKKNSKTDSLPVFIEAEPEITSTSQEVLETGFGSALEDTQRSSRNPAFDKVHSERISRMLKSWAKAKSGNGSDAFYAYYDSRELAAVLPPKPDDGEVRALEPSVQFISNDQANVVFDEWSGPYAKRTRLFKQLNLALVESEWKITGEKVIHVY